jgi:hypothetical protein
MKRQEHAMRRIVFCISLLSIAVPGVSVYSFREQVAYYFVGLVLIDLSPSTAFKA